MTSISKGAIWHTYRAVGFSPTTRGLSPAVTRGPFFLIEDIDGSAEVKREGEIVETAGAVAWKDVEAAVMVVETAGAVAWKDVEAAVVVVETAGAVAWKLVEAAGAASETAEKVTGKLVEAAGAASEMAEKVAGKLVEATGAASETAEKVAEKAGVPGTSELGESTDDDPIELGAATADLASDAYKLAL